MSRMDEEGDISGEVVGDGGEDVAAESAQEGGLAADAHEHAFDVVGGGVIEDGVGDVRADNVHGDHRDAGFAADFGGAAEGVAGFVVVIDGHDRHGAQRHHIHLPDKEHQEN